MKFALFNIDCAYLFVDIFIACFYIDRMEWKIGGKIIKFFTENCSSRQF